MTRSELDLIRRALQLLHRLVPDDEPRESYPPRRCPVAMFADKFLKRDPASHQSSQELWTFFGEVAASGEVEALSKTEFLRRLPAAMEYVFGVRKSHNIEWDGGRVRGFKGVGLRE